MKPHVEVAKFYLGDTFRKTVEKETPESPTDDCHLTWMLGQIVMEYMSDTKANRWLGYIQGIMVSKGYLDVSAERDRTRNIFKGS